MSRNSSNSSIATSVTSLSERQLKALPFLAGCPTLTEGTKLAEISRTTFYRWLEDDDFRGELERLRNEAVEFAQIELKGLMLKSVMVLGEALEDSNPSIRLRAAHIALSTHIKVNELKEIEKRLDLLDNALPLWSERNRKW